MQDKIIAAIAVKLNEYDTLVSLYDVEEMAQSIAAAIAPLVDKNEEYLEKINTEMWQTWGIKDAPFGREEGEKIMSILNEWAGDTKPIQKADKCKEAIEYYFSVLDEVRGVEWRKTPDHVTKKMIEAVEAIKK